MRKKVTLLSDDDVRAALRRLIRDRYDGVQRRFAEAIEVSDYYVSMVLSGAKPPGPRILAELNLRRVVRYER